MGNLAIKCETRWQERKVVTVCERRGTVDVRVMKADGSGVEEFNRPVVVAEVMYQFPDYVIVRWCPKRNTKLGKRGQLRVLQRHEVLTPGEIYILFPIPVEVIKNNQNTARRSRSMQSTKDRLSLLLQRSGKGTTTVIDDSIQEQQQPLRYDEKLSNDGMSEGAKETQLPSSLGFRVGARKPNSFADLIQGEKETSGIVEDEEKSSRIPALYLSPFFVGSSWRPALVSIPESPIGFHSRPDSPKPPIAFRLVSTRSSQDLDEPK